MRLLIIIYSFSIQIDDDYNNSTFTHAVNSCLFRIHFVSPKYCCWFWIEMSSCFENVNLKMPNYALIWIKKKFNVTLDALIKMNISIWTEMLKSNREHRLKFEYQPWARIYNNNNGKSRHGCDYIRRFKEMWNEEEKKVLTMENIVENLHISTIIYGNTYCICDHHPLCSRLG